MSDSNNAPAAPLPAVTPLTRDLLGKAAPWLKFLTVVGYVGLGILVVLALVMFVVGGTVPLFGGSAGIIAGIVYLVFAVVLFFPVRMLGRMAKAAKAYKTEGEPSSLEKIAAGIRSLSLFYGIYAIVVLSILVLAILFALVLGGMFLGSLTS